MEPFTNEAHIQFRAVHGCLVNSHSVYPVMSCYSSKNNDTPSPTIRLRHATLPQLVRGLELGSLTSTQLVATYKARISEVNHECNAVIETATQATQIAQLLDLERRLRGSRSSIHGIPILLKDNIPTLDGTDTACGSIALVGSRPSREAAVVTALRAAGAVLLGKANMAEWSGFRSTSGCSGWSARGGLKRSVFYPNMKASGSSSGSAVAVAMGLCFAAIGTELYLNVMEFSSVQYTDLLRRAIL